MAKVVNIGFGNVVVVEKIAAIVSPEPAPIRRIVSQAKANGKLIDATHGRRTRAVIILESDHVVLSSILPTTIGERAEKTFTDEDKKNFKEEIK